MREKGPRELKKDRVYEIYGISKKDRKKYSIHHIVFKSDPKKYACFKDFDVDKIANLCPLLKKDHKRLHDELL